MEGERFRREFEKPSEYIPTNLDIVCIDGKYYQVAGSKPNRGIFSAAPLSEKGMTRDFEVDRFNFQKAPTALSSVGDIRGELSDEEYANIIWGSDHPSDTPLKDIVTFFGYYTTKG